MKILLFINDTFGINIAEIFNQNDAPVDTIVFTDTASKEYISNISSLMSYNQLLKYEDFKKIYKGKVDIWDMGILCWWPHIISEEIIKTTQLGLLNFHPSLLPWGRGKHPNFWTFVDKTPFGATIHWVNHSIDGGDIAYQSEIDKSWEYNAGDIYSKARACLLSMFKDNFSEICSGRAPRIKQSLKTKIRYSREIDDASYIDLDKQYIARDLLNLLRARTFPEQPSCWFNDDGKYSVSISINKIDEVDE